MFQLHLFYLSTLVTSVKNYKTRASRYIYFALGSNYKFFLAFYSPLDRLCFNRSWTSINDGKYEELIARYSLPHAPETQAWLKDVLS